METGSNPPDQPQSPQPPQAPPPPAQPQAPAPQAPPPGQAPAPSAPAQQAYAPRDPGNTPAVVGLVLGIVGIIMFPLAAPFAWWQGIVGKRRVDEGKTTQNRGMAVAGQVLGIIGTVLMVIYFLVFVIAIVVAASN